MKGTLQTARGTRSEAIQLTDAIKDDLRALTQTFWDVGDKLRRVREQALFRALAYDTFEAYVEAELGVQIRQALKMLRVVRVYARGDAAAIGLERSTALIRLCNARGGKLDPGELVRTNAEIAPGVTILAATVDQIDEAARAAKKARALKRGRAEGVRRQVREDKATIAHLRQLLVGAGLPRVRITLRGDEAHIVVPRSRIQRPND